MSCSILIQSHRSGNGQRQGAGPPVPTSVKLQQFKPVSKFYRQLLCNGSPVSQWHGPFLAYIAVSEVNQFLKGGVVREHALVFCHFPYLAMIALNCICGINHTAYIRCELEVFSKFFPVVLP